MLHPQHSSPIRATSPHNQSSPPSSPLGYIFDQRRASFKRGGVSSPWRDRQRCLFLDKVRSGRDTKFLHGRGGEDEMMRIMYASEKKRTERALEREAQNIGPVDPEELEVEFFEEIQKHEEKELEACLSHFYSQQDTPFSQQQNSSRPLTCQRCNNNMEQTEEGVLCFTCGWSCAS